MIDFKQYKEPTAETDRCWYCWDEFYWEPPHLARCKNCDEYYWPPRSNPYLNNFEFRAVFRYQGGRCAICNEKARLYVDHDHDTNLFRALLCIGCNTGLGKFNHDPGLLSIAANYINKYKSPKPSPLVVLVRSLVEKDLATLQGPPPPPPPPVSVKILRAFHHGVARKLGQGIPLDEREAEYAARIGSDPSFANLIAGYKELEEK